MVAMALQLVLAQRLVRLLCPQCAEPETPDERERLWLQSRIDPTGPAPDRLYRARGCASCNHTGFRGRTGVYEMIEMNQQLVDALAHGEPNAFEVAARHQMAGRTLGADAARLAVAGRTTLDEAMRVDNALS
jgi:MSHA biogenesis protein MshE